MARECSRSSTRSGACVIPYLPGPLSTEIRARRRQPTGGGRTPSIRPRRQGEKLMSHAGEHAHPHMQDPEAHLMAVEEDLDSLWVDIHEEWLERSPAHRGGVLRDAGH